MTLLSRISLDAMLAVRDRYFAPSVLSPFADDMARRLARAQHRARCWKSPPAPGC